MKKVLCSIAAASLLLGGCSKKEVSEVSSVKEEQVRDDYGIWLMKPEQDYTAVYELNPKGQGLLQIDTQKFGHLDIAYEMEMDEHPSTMAGYVSDAVVVEKKQQTGNCQYEWKRTAAS